MEKQPKDLPNTTYAVLGILSFGGELSGYEIRKKAENLRFFYWSPAQSQIYLELRRLSDLGLVESREVEQQSKPDKRLYKINERGQQALSRWLNEEPVEPPLIKHSVALRIFFGHMARPERLREVLKEYIAQTERLLDELSEVRHKIDEKFTYPQMVAAWGVHYYQSEIRAAQELLEQLSSGR